MKSLRGILVVGEKNIFIELTQIIAIATEANTLVSSMFNVDVKEKQVTEAMHAMQIA